MVNRLKTVDGVLVEMSDDEEAARTAEEFEATRPRTPAEITAEQDELADKFIDQSFVQDKRLLAMAIVLRETVKMVKTGDQSFFASVTTNSDFKDLVRSVYKGLL